jgi:hypothetical protein
LLPFPPISTVIHSACQFTRADVVMVRTLWMYNVQSTECECINKLPKKPHSTDLETEAVRSKAIHPMPNRQMRTWGCTYKSV